LFIFIHSVAFIIAGIIWVVQGLVGEGISLILSGTLFLVLLYYSKGKV
jgi:hypothetical protein